MGVSLIISKSSYSRGEKQYKTIYVSKGDTLWSIAKSNQDSNEYYKGKDIRYIMNDITQINNIESSNLKIDQELKVPVM